MHLTLTAAKIHTCRGPWSSTTASGSAWGLAATADPDCSEASSRTCPNACSQQTHHSEISWAEVQLSCGEDSKLTAAGRHLGISGWSGCCWSWWQARRCIHMMTAAEEPTTGQLPKKRASSEFDTCRAWWMSSAMFADREDCRKHTWRIQAVACAPVWADEAPWWSFLTASTGQTLPKGATGQTTNPAPDAHMMCIYAAIPAFEPDQVAHVVTAACIEKATQEWHVPWMSVACPSSMAAMQ